ncbi:uncharacterized protein LOC136083828 [Hydra vulgaris]|uniref:Uncharacterized protein LOC136083828 n=1 Tax=Hydra vulgaris TaxID=6087 RepID=A0ABM4CDL8_HYDVU
MKQNIKKIKMGRKFSLSYDEYTSLRHRRYIGFNLHENECKKTYKTGLIRTYGSCPAENLTQNIKVHLNSFGVCMERDVVGSTQDGAAINKKLMQLTDIVDQLCFNHAIHLGVCDTLYKKNKDINVPAPKETDSDSEEDEHGIYNDNFSFESVNNEINVVYPKILINVRKVVKFIKMSSVRNQIFQKKVTEEFGKEIELHLDVCHRWNSLFSMTAPLLKTKKCLFQTSTELNALGVINKLDFESLASLHAVLEPAKLAVEFLSREDATFSTADTVLKFILSKLFAMNTEIASLLHSNLKKRIDKRINGNVMQLLKCLKVAPSVVPL